MDLTPVSTLNSLISVTWTFTCTQVNPPSSKLQSCWRSAAALGVTAPLWLQVLLAVQLAPQPAVQLLY